MRSPDCGTAGRPQWEMGETCSILTTTPNAVTAPVHNRMPVTLQADRYNLWLDPGATNVQMILKLLQPYDAQLMRRYPVSGRINHVSNDHPECSQPLDQVRR